MALFNSDKTQATSDEQKATTTAVSTDVLAGFDGAGLEALDAGDCGQAYLGMVQPGSGAEGDENPVGTWHNTATGENYGDHVDVILVGIQKIWSERDKNPPYTTVGRYAVGGLNVNEVPLAPGKRGVPKMVNPLTGNEVQELYVLAVLLADHPEDGVLIFSPTAGSMKACRMLNKQLFSLRHTAPDGKVTTAPIFKYRWTLKLEKYLPEGQKGESAMKVRLASATRGAAVETNRVTEYAIPAYQLARTNTQALIAAPAEE